MFMISVFQFCLACLVYLDVFLKDGYQEHDEKTREYADVVEKQMEIVFCFDQLGQLGTRWKYWSEHE